MASPLNPLDVYSTYTYHFELHAASSWSDLQSLDQAGPSEAVTTPYESNGTLIVNTRKDAHQTIDNVKINYTVPQGDPTGQMTPYAEVTMDVFEPNGVFFVEKLINHREKLNSKAFNSLQFALRVFFVGRYPDNRIDIIKVERMFPLNLANMSAAIDHRGASYSMLFVFNSALLSNDPRQKRWNNFARTLGVLDRDISIKGRTVREMIQDLEDKLNTNVRRNWEPGYAEFIGRKLKYKINLDPQINGQIAVNAVDSYSPDSKKMIAFPMGTPLGQMITKILYSSPEVNDMISKSKDGVKREFQQGVNLVTLNPRYHLKPGEAEVAFDVLLFKGGANDTSKYVFAYYFAVPPGTNIDVIDFDLRLAGIFQWLSLGSESTSRHGDFASTAQLRDPVNFKKNVVHPDVTQDELGKVPDSVTNRIEIGPNDVLLPPAITQAAKRGFVNIELSAAGVARTSLNTIHDAATAKGDTQLTFTIRGRPDLLGSIVTYPNADQTQVYAIGAKNNMWVKVNIFSYNPDTKQQIPFFYTGYYLVLAIDSTFSGGKFTQKLTVVMTDPINGTATATISPQTNITQQRVPASVDNPFVNPRLRGFGGA